MRNYYLILRNKKISPTAKNVQLSVCYGDVDVKRMMQWIFLCYYYKGSDWRLKEILAEPHSEQDILYLLTIDPKCFGNFQGKWGKLLSEWCFNLALRNQYIISSVVDKNVYYFTESCVEKHRGRPKKSK